MKYMMLYGGPRTLSANTKWSLGCPNIVFSASVKSVLCTINIWLQLGSRFIILKILASIHVRVWMIQVNLLWVGTMHRRHHLSPSPPIHPYYIHSSLQNLFWKFGKYICLWGFIKNYQHAMQRVEITIMWYDPVTSLHFLFREFSIPTLLHCIILPLSVHTVKQ